MHVYDIEHDFEFGQQWAEWGHLPKCLCTLHLIEKGRKERKWVCRYSIINSLRWPAVSLRAYFQSTLKLPLFELVLRGTQKYIPNIYPEPFEPLKTKLEKLNSRN